ncbi:hypothetical protein ACS0TY_003927 [Phlomoides rotata]
MKILSINARGTNSCRKRRAIKNHIFETKAEMVCIQKSKREVVNQEFCESFWPDKDLGWVYSGSMGASGGIITLWKKPAFSLDNQWGVPGALAIKGTWTGGMKKFNLINIYAPSGTKDQHRLWEDIQVWITGQQDEMWCVCGDFNTFTNQSERKGGKRPVSDKRSINFCKFIVNSELIDLPLLRMKYNWYKYNGTCCSRIDRFLVSNNWCSLWHNLKQSGLKRTFSDHAPILLEASNQDNWGPIPFKIVNWWNDQKDFRILVENT